MKEKKKILVVYIATGDYKLMWDGFKESLHHFCPTEDVKVAYVNDLPLNQHTPGVDVELHIDHFPWPIVALMKYKHIMNAIIAYHDTTVNDSLDYVVYFNSNIKFIKDVSFEEFFDESKITAVEHCTWEFNKHDPKALLFGGRVKPKESKAYIPSDEYTYIQTSVFGGPIKLINWMLMDCHAWTVHDLAHNIIPTWHDESYGNKWVYDNRKYVRILSNKYNASEADLDKWGPDDPSIVMRDSSRTQWKYKEQYHT